MWIMNKDIIRAFGAWVACWAHKKDWRVCALKNCLHTRIKRASREEILMFAKAKRGVALLREFASLTVHHLNEWIASSKVDIESIHHNLTLEELMRQEVFKIDEKDKAMQLVWKIDRLMREDTTRLDHLAIWDGKMLLQVDIFMDDLEALQAEKDKENGVNDPASEIRVLNVDLSPVGITKQSAQMNISSERMVDTWAWGYILDISQGKQNAPAKLQAVKAKLVVQEYGIAMVHVVDVINQTEKFVSELKPGLGPDEQWYDFEFGEYDEEGNYQQVLVEWEDGFAVVVSISDRGSKDDSQTPCRFVYFLDHRPTRAINPQVKVRPGSFNGKWHFTPASRSAELQVLLRVDASFGRDAEKEEQEQPTPTSYQKGVEKVQAAHRRVEDLLRKKRKKEKYDPKQLEEARIELRRLALGSCDEMFEDRLGNIPSMKLLIDAPTHSTCAYHPKMREFWMLDPNIQLNFIICGLDGRLKRDVTLMSIDNLKIFSFCFDDEGDMFIANNQHTFYRYIPADGELCATYLRMWKVDLFDPVYPHNSWHNASGITADYNSIYGIFKLGPILQMSKAAGSVMRIIRLQFEVSNIEQVTLRDLYF